MLAGCSGYIERRTDRDGAEAAIHLSKMLMLGDASGLLFAVVRGNGRIEVGISGCLYDSPMIAAGIASQALSVASHWHFDPGNYITDET